MDTTHWKSKSANVGNVNKLKRSGAVVAFSHSHLSNSNGLLLLIITR